LFTTPLAGGAVCPAGGLTAWTAALFGYSSFLGEKCLSSCLGSVGTPEVEPQKVKPESVTANKGLAVGLHSLGNHTL